MAGLPIIKMEKIISLLKFRKKLKAGISVGEKKNMFLLYE